MNGLRWHTPEVPVLEIEITVQISSGSAVAATSRTFDLTICAHTNSQYSEATTIESSA